MRRVDEDLELIELTNTEAEDAEALSMDAEEEKQRKTKKEDSLAYSILKNSLYFLGVLIVSLLFIEYVAQRTLVVGESMHPTLENRDNLLVDKLTYRFEEPERFDIIVFKFPLQDNTYYIKRVIGLPGETVLIDTEGNIYIDGQILEENYGAEVIWDPGIAFQPVTLGPDEYFVLGDNRNHSSDSRNLAVGKISKDLIIGKALLRIYPFSEITFL